jgi:hypothetical protein
MAHWLDSDVLINAKNDAYGFDFAPGFWEFLSDGFANGQFSLCDAVAQEIFQRDDELANWVRALPDGAIVIQDRAVQSEYQPIADHIESGEYPNRRKFLAGADGWLIAHARFDGGVVVSQETRAGAGPEAKIPDIGTRFGVNVITRGQLLRNFGVRLIRG